MVQLLTRAEAARLLRISLPTLDRLTKEGALKRVVLGKRVLFAVTDIEAAITASKTSKNNTVFQERRRNFCVK